MSDETVAVPTPAAMAAAAEIFQHANEWDILPEEVARIIDRHAQALLDAGAGEPACKWKPIADAPHDNADIILLIADNSRGSAFWHDGSECYGHRGKAGWFWSEDRGNLLTASNADCEMYPAIAFMSFNDLPQPKQLGRGGEG